jgi:glycosyltransferase involved in cell wall biosynthesis
MEGDTTHEVGGWGGFSAGTDDGSKLRILVVTVSAGGIGGMQRHTHDLVRGLVSSGHDVEVMCPAAAGLDSSLHGARWTLVEPAGRADPRWPASVVEAFRAAQQRKPFNVIHSESTSALPLAQIVRGSTPVVVKYHGNYIGLARAHVRRMLSRPRTAHREAAGLYHVTRVHFGHGNAWAFRDCISMVASRQQARDTARSHFIPRELIHVVPNGVDVGHFTPGDKPALRRSLSLPMDALLLATAGRLNLEKGFDVAIEALASLRRAHPAARLLVVGDGEERGRLEVLARRLGVDGATDFVGRQARDKIPQYLAAADVFLFPTRRDEAGPLVLIEAMACGLPVIASSLGGITEVLDTPGPAPGVLVRAGDSDELARAASRLIADEELRAAVGAAARNRAVGVYGLETMVRRTVAVYRIAIRRASDTGRQRHFVADSA